MSIHSFWDPNLPSISSYPFPSSHIFPLLATTTGVRGVGVSSPLGVLQSCAQTDKAGAEGPVAPTFVLFHLPNVTSMIQQKRAEPLSFP